VKRAALALALLAAPLAAPAAGQPGRDLAAGCAICHGTDGRPASADMPALAGMPAAQFIRRMREFREDARAATVMHQIARGYSDSQVEAMAAWFAARRR